jgi:PPOX class probable F420-dependent enzyme
MPAETDPSKSAAFPALAGHNYLRLTTFRKSGEPVPTPVWFAQVGDHLYVTTDGESGKVRRIRNNAQVEVAPCDMQGKVLGGSAEAMARILPVAEEAVAHAALKRKYGWQFRMFGAFGALRRRPRVHLDITPM